MPDILNVFDSVEYLEPKCPKCKVVLEYDTNTKFDDKKQAHICLSCGFVLK